MQYVEAVEVVGLEDQLRRRARKLGLSVHKDRARSISLDHQGGYQLYNPYSNFILAGVRYELTLDDLKTLLGEAQP
jgi:hypothetical protein